MEGSLSSKMITLKSNDGGEFVVSETVAMQSRTIRHMIEDDCADKPIPLTNVDAKILEKVIQYCEQHVNAAHVSKAETTDEGSSTNLGSSRITDKELEKWDWQFLDVDKEAIFSLILAANYLDISTLLDAACEKVAKMMKGKNPEEICQIFSIKNDLNPSEEQEICSKNQWAFE